MAKKKPKTVAEIPALEIKKFGASMLGTAHNVFTRARLNWGSQLDADDTLFDRLKAECGVEKCENCDQWKASSEMCKTVPDWCEECVAEDEDDAEDEE